MVPYTSLLRIRSTTMTEELETYVLSIPEGCMGEVCGELCTRGGSILGMENDEGVCEVRARMPRSAMTGFEDWLARVTSNRGHVAMSDDDEAKDRFAQLRSRARELEVAAERLKSGKSDGGPFCSFCGKEKSEVKELIAGPNVFICDECVALCNDILAGKNADE